MNIDKEMMEWQRAVVAARWRTLWRVALGTIVFAVFATPLALTIALGVPIAPRVVYFAGAGLGIAISVASGYFPRRRSIMA